MCYFEGFLSSLQELTIFDTNVDANVPKYKIGLEVEPTLLEITDKHVISTLKFYLLKRLSNIWSFHKFWNFSWEFLGENLADQPKIFFGPIYFYQIHFESDTIITKVSNVKKASSSPNAFGGSSYLLVQ